MAYHISDLSSTFLRRKGAALAKVITVGYDEGVKKLLLFFILFFLSGRPAFADIDSGVGIVLAPDPPIINRGSQLSISISGLPQEDFSYTLEVKKDGTTIASIPITTTAEPSCTVGIPSSDVWLGGRDCGGIPFGVSLSIDTSKTTPVLTEDTPYTLEFSEASGGAPIILGFTVRSSVAGTCTIASDEFACAEGVCKSTQYDCVDGHPCYNDSFKNAGTSCVLQPKTPAFHCDATRSCAGAITCWVSTRPDPITTAGETADIIVQTSGLSDSIEYWITLNGQFIRQGLNYIAGRQVAFKPKEGVMEIKNVNTLGIRDPVDVLQQRTFEKKTYDIDILDSSTGKSLCKASFIVGTANFLIKCDAADAKCKECLGPNPGNPAGIPTPWGTCFETNAAGLIGGLFGIILGLAGGIALILIIYSGYRMMVSAGNPEALQGARETLTSAIIGLLFIIFSFVILEVIGVDILKIPSFGEALAPRDTRVQCQNRTFIVNNPGTCGSNEARAHCQGVEEIIRTTPPEEVSQANGDFFDLCVSKGYIR